MYRIRAKKGGTYSKYVTTSVINTPLCWKTNQATRTNVVINVLNIAAGKTVNVDWGDGTNANYTGDNTDITKTYAASATNIFNVKLSGDTDSIKYFSHNTQAKSYGVVSNWVLPSSLQYFYIYSTGVSGALPNIQTISSMLNYQALTCNMSSTNIITFGVGLTIFNISGQKVSFPTSEIDKLLKAAADYYQVNAPTANCTFNLSGANMGIPTDGVSNVDIVRLIGYYTAAGFTATVTVRTS